MPGQKLNHVEFFNARACSSPNFGFQACSILLSTRIFIFEHARARSMLGFFILDATLLATIPTQRVMKFAVKIKLYLFSEITSFSIIPTPVIEV